MPAALWLGTATSSEIGVQTHNHQKNKFMDEEVQKLVVLIEQIITQTLGVPQTLHTSTDPYKNL